MKGAELKESTQESNKPDDDKSDNGDEMSLLTKKMKKLWKNKNK